MFHGRHHMEQTARLMGAIRDRVGRPLFLQCVHLLPGQALA